MVKRTQQPARETKQEAKDATKAKNGLFASCTFSSLGLDPKLSDQLQGSLFFVSTCLMSFTLYINSCFFGVKFYTERMGFEAPTHVQAQSIPVILSGRDVYPFV